MHVSRLSVLFAGALAVVVSAGAASAHMHSGDSGAGHGAMSGQGMTMEGASQAYMDAMATMDEAMRDMEMTGDAGIDFARMMIPHHQSAIDMAEAYLAEGDDEELRTLSEEIVAEQQREIDFLQEWLDNNAQ
jgi:uncharacterized protein (DUF305 family)